MTRISLPGAAFTEAASWAAELAPRRPTEPHLAGVLVVAHDDGRVTMSASDYDVSGRVVAARAEVGEPGTVLVSARLLADVARTTARESQVQLVTRDDGSSSLDVLAGRSSSWSLPLLDPHYYPALPFLVAPAAQVPAAAFGHAVDRVMVACSDPVTKPMYGGVAIGAAADGPLVIATTDRYRLAVAELAWTAPLGVTVSAPTAPTPDGVPEVIVPGPVLRHVVAATRDAGDDDHVVLHCDGVGFAATTGRHAVNGRVIDQQSVWRIMDVPSFAKRYEGSVSARVEDIRAALDRAMVVVDGGQDEPLAVRVDADGIGIRPMWGTKARGEHTCLTLGFEGEPREFGVKPSHLRDILAAVEAPQVQFEFASRRGAVMILARPLTDTGVRDGFRISQAPVRVSAAKADAA